MGLCDEATITYPPPPKWPVKFAYVKFWLVHADVRMWALQPISGSVIDCQQAECMLRTAVSNHFQHREKNVFSCVWLSYFI